MTVMTSVPIVVVPSPIDFSRVVEELTAAVASKDFMATSSLRAAEEAIAPDEPQLLVLGVTKESYPELARFATVMKKRNPKLLRCLLADPGFEAPRDKAFAFFIHRGQDSGGAGISRELVVYMRDYLARYSR